MYGDPSTRSFYDKISHMSISSNFYAEKVFSEHPLGLWPMDEKVDYINFLTEPASDLTNTEVWSVSKGSVVKEFIKRPFEDLPAFNILNDNSFEIDVFAESVTENYFNPRLKTISVGFYLFAETDNVQSFEMGFLSNPSGGSFYNNEETETSFFDIKEYRRWHFYQKTFNLFEEEFIDLEEILTPVGAPAQLFKSNHGLGEGDPIILSSTGKLPQNIFENTKYFVRYVDENFFNISKSPDSDLIIATSAGSGSHTVIPVKSMGLRFKFLLTDSSYASVFMNGLSIGQDSEEFQERSLGVVPQTLPEINIDPTLMGVKSLSYGLEENPGYYLIKNNKLLAKNKNMPMVFGTESLTSLYQNSSSEPSLIFPSFGFLNESGKFRTYTAEFWLRINANFDKPFRIFGPVESDDGLYVDGPFITLKIGRFSKSHYWGDPYRPMLVNVITFPGGASLVINGEKLFDLSYLVEEIVLPSVLDGKGRDNNWIAFYSNEDALSFEVDCFAIYPYRVATSLSKRRYVYGQAVEFPENIVSLYNGKSFLADYPFSGYGINYSYPDIGRWNRGVLDNLIPEKNTVRPPKYLLPDFVFNNKTQDDWFQELRRKQLSSIKLKPSESWNNTDGYIFFDKVNVAQGEVGCFYGVFEAKLDQDEKEVLFRIENALTSDYLESVVEKKHVSISEIIENEHLVFFKQNHGLKTGDLVTFDDSSTLPINIVGNKEYRVVLIDKNSFYVSESIVDSFVKTFKNVDFVAMDVPGKIFAKNHNLQDNDVVVFSSTNTLPLGIVRDREYYVRVETEDSFLLSESVISESTPEESFVPIGSNGNGTHFFKRIVSENIVASCFLVSYYFLKSGQETLIHQSPGISLGHLFVAGIDLREFANFFGGNVSAFLKNMRQLKIYFGGSKNFSNTFSGRIHRIGFSNRKNSKKLKFLFDRTGIPFLRHQFDGNGVDLPEEFSFVDGGKAYQKFIDDIMSHISSYTLFIKNEFKKSELEIATSSSWQDYLPLSYFAKPVLRKNGKRESKLNFFQFNIDYPTPEVFRNSCCDTSRSAVKTYISFQYVKEGANKLPEQFSQTLTPPQNNLILPGIEWKTTRYEVVNNSIIYLPPNVKTSELAIVIDMEIESGGIFLKPIRIKSLSLSGRSLNEISPNEIVSRSGARAYPFVKYGFYADHDDFNPFSIYRDSTPYLYLTKYSGIKLQGSFGQTSNRSISIPINPEKKSLFSLSALQFSMRFENPESLNQDLLLFEIQSGNDYYGIKVGSIHPENKKVFVYAINKSGEKVSDIGFYLNGKLTESPVISLREWNMLGLALSNPIRMESRPGEFRIVGPVNFNNFSYYALSTTQEAQALTSPIRSKVFYEDQYFGINPSEIYAIYTGTNRLVAKNQNLLNIKKYQYSVFSNNNLRSETLKAF
jgi:hypothetical protein